MMNPRALSLYRQLLRYGRNLRFTDKDYFATRIRDEFEKCRHLNNEADIDYALRKGEALLKKGRVVWPR